MSTNNQTPHQFSVMLSPQERKSLEIPAVIPWGLIERHTRQAVRNHGQTLERLNERGGLSPRELYYVLRDERWPGTHRMVSVEVATRYIEERMDQYEKEEIA